MKFLVKLFPEITIKSKPVRNQQIRYLRQNIRKILGSIDPAIEVISRWDKIEVLCPAQATAEAVQALGDQVADALQRIPGISNSVQVVDFEFTDFDEILQRTLTFLGDSLVGLRFAVRVKRAGRHAFTSTGLEKFLGAGLMQHSGAAGVDLRNPDITVRLEVRDSRVYLVVRRIEGLGGFPLGSQDSVMALMSGGFDSSVAAWMAMRRGLRTHFLFFNLGGTAHEVGVRQAAWHLWDRYAASHAVRFISVPFDGVVDELLRSVHHAQMGVVLKRMMLRAAERIAANLNVGALVTGESVAQVSSQTLANLAIIDKATSMLVLRPLAVMDKPEIIRIATQIGTEVFARNMPEYCSVISDRPTTRARDYRIAANELKFDDAVLDDAIARAQSISINQVMESIPLINDVEQVQTPGQHDVVVDIRHPDEREKNPLTLIDNPVLQVPFYELQQQWASLDPNQRYLLYCDQGSMSQLHAGQLVGQGFSNVRVYRRA